MSILKNLQVRLGLGTLRLTTTGRPDPLESLNLIQFALNQGIRVIDVADSYCLNDEEFHFGEHLVRQAKQSWGGDTDEIRILTKVGMRRPGGKWVPCGTPEHISKSVDVSLTALGVEQIFLLQLHVRDPLVPFEKTLTALAEIQESGKTRHIGLCNVSLAEIEQAQKYISIASIQNELNILNTQSASLGVLEFCETNDIPFLAHRPLGGHANTKKLLENPVLSPLAERHGGTPHEIALAALLHASPCVIPLIGATRLSSVKSCVKAVSTSLDVSDQMALSLQCSFEPAVSAQLVDRSSKVSKATGEDSGPSESPEIVVLMGIQGAGKSSLVQQYLDHGYARLNRDEIGGTLDGLIPRLEKLLIDGMNRVVLDNTYPTQASRMPVIRAGVSQGIAVRCLFLNTPIQEANINVVQRMIQKYGMPLGPDEMKFFRKADPTLPPPQALLKWLHSFEPPTTAEGFTTVEEVAFVRTENANHDQKGLYLDVDGTLRTTKSGEVYPRSADDVVVLPGRKEALTNWVQAGYKLFFVSNQSGVASGRVTHDAVQAAMFRTAELLEVPIAEVVYCSHPYKPVGCFCRKPMPGLGVYLMERHQLSRDSLVMVGDRDTDSQFASGLGIRYFDEGEFFRPGGVDPETVATK